MRARDVHVEVELLPPASNGTEVQENVTQATIVDLERYLRWADKALHSRKAHKKKSSSPLDKKVA